MKKVLRLICVILILVLISTAFIGCDLFKLNNDRYRGQTILELPNINVNLGELIDFMEVKAGSYWGDSQYDPQEVWDFFYPQFISQMSIVDTYVLANKSKVATGKPHDYYTYGGYMTKEDIKYYYDSMVLSLFEAVDSQVETTFTDKGYTFNKAEEETTAVKETVLLENEIVMADFKRDLETLSKDIAKYTVNEVGQPLSYVFDITADAEKIDAFVKKLNKRNTEDEDGVKKEEITPADYIKAQKSAFDTVVRNIKVRYDISIDKYVERQMNQALTSEVVVKWTIEQYQSIFNEATKLDANGKNDVDRYIAKLTREQAEKYNIDVNAFGTAISSLTDTSFVLSVPPAYAGQYAYVRNILIPFSEDQTSALSAYKADGHTTEDVAKLRDKLAAEIEVKDFFATKDSEGEYPSIGKKFTINNGIATSAWFDGLFASASNKDKFISDSLYQYNTDPGSQNKAYGYVINKSIKNTQFVTEFADVAMEVANMNKNEYKMVVTDFGVHIIVNTGDVGVDSFADKTLAGLTGAGSNYYRATKAYVDSIKSARYEDVKLAIFHDYMDNGKVKSIDSALKMLTKNLGVELNKKK